MFPPLTWDPILALAFVAMQWTRTSNQLFFFSPEDYSLGPAHSLLYTLLHWDKGGMREGNCAVGKRQPRWPSTCSSSDGLYQLKLFLQLQSKFISVSYMKCSYKAQPNASLALLGRALIPPHYFTLLLFPGTAMPFLSWLWCLPDSAVTWFKFLNQQSPALARENNWISAGYRVELAQKRAWQAPELV